MFKQFIVTLLILACARGVYAADPRIVHPTGEPHVGEEFVLAVEQSSIPSNSEVEWGFVSGNENVNAMRLRAGGREFVFTPINSKPVVITATVRDARGNVTGSSTQTINAKEFNIEISVIVEEPLTLWDSIERADVQTDALLTERPIKLTAKLNPEFKGEHKFSWTVDASTQLIEGDAPDDIFIQRSQTGDSEIIVAAFNAAGIRLGGGEKTVSVTLPLEVFNESNKRKAAWNDWLNAQNLWQEGNYAEAVALGKQAQDNAPRDPDIENGFKSMSANYARYIRGVEFRNKAIEQRDNMQYVEALQSMRRAQSVWPQDENLNDIQDLEKIIDEIRVKLQRAQWLRDTATAYDQEGLFEDALEYYSKSLEIVSSDAVENRIARIKERLVKIADADRYAGEGSALERDGRLQEAINHYSASIVSNPDNTLKQHIEELQRVMTRRERQAQTLYKEALELQKKGSASDALQRFRESRELWEMPEVAKRIKDLERNVKDERPLRGPDDFGIGTRADAARLIKDADNLFLQRRNEEAAALYRKALAIAPGDDLRNWINNLENNIRERRAAQAANNQIKEANALFRTGKVDEAAAKYLESLATHPNAEVEAFLKSHGINTNANAQPENQQKNPPTRNQGRR